MPLYRKKPVVIEARRFTDESFGYELADWSGGTNENFPGQIQINTLEGIMTAELGDYIIKGVKGEFYPCKSEIFELTYEPEY